ncbi:MAG: CZB domain-containing protein [Alphaproteobacteria bacterium]|nr:CZB domain-containing protein [Alphaproteobacteria bacterium]
MGFFGSKPADLPRSTSSLSIETPPSGTVDESALLEALDLLERQAFHSMPDKDSAICQKLRQVAAAYEQRALDSVKRMVVLSVESNEAVVQTAQLLRDLRDVDHQTQSIAAAAEELVSSVHQIAASAGQASQDVAAAQDQASESRHSAERAVASMDGISRAVSEAAGRVETLAEASTQIGGIVDQIEAIAKQTNLLALNATIEAARAGEAGKGFAVVASEVKNLANQTAKATDDIRKRIENLRGEMAAIVSSMEQGANAVQQGQEVIAATGQGMQTVSEQIDHISAMVRDIAGILDQQSQTSEEVANRINSIASRTEHGVQAVIGILDVMDKSETVVTESIAEAVKAEVKDITIHVAKSDHKLWLKKLAAMAAGRIKLDPEQLTNHNTCRLGKWYNGITDASIKNHPAYGAILAPHEKVHAFGISAVRKYNQGDFDGALAEIEKASQASVDVMRLLDELANRR